MSENNLKKQMGNARFLITRSSTGLDNYLLVCKTMRLGREEWFEDKKFTRMDVSPDGTKRWSLIQTGMIHRADGPAIEWADGEKWWIYKGKMNRLGGPAIERVNGRIEWWVEDKLHRENGPAVEGKDGYKAWYVNGSHRARVDGPAIEWPDGEKWWLV